MDFRKAYDSVDRRLLVERLAAMGVWGKMLLAVTSMYQQVPMCARVQGQVGPMFNSSVGVKQGDPLSPLLFGLFIDELEAFMADKAPGVGVSVAERLCQMLLYADDVVLFSESAADLQLQLNALREFADTKHMSVNVDKTKIVVCQPQPRDQFTWVYDGLPVESVLEFKYLGIHLHASAGFMGAHEVIKGTAVKAMWGMVRQLRDREIESVGIRVHMFNTLVMPIMLYGCEIWATRFIPQTPEAPG